MKSNKFRWVGTPTDKKNNTMKLPYHLSMLLICLAINDIRSQVVVTFSMSDTSQAMQLNFVNGVTSDSVFSCFCSSGSFVVPDVNFCPTLTLDTKSETHGYDFVYLSLDKPTVEFQITLNDGLPMLHFENDTFNQVYFEYANTLRPIKWHQRQLNKAMRDTSKNVDSLYKEWRQSLHDFSNVQYTFYTQHGHQSRARLLYAYNALFSRSMAKDSIRAVFEGMRGYAESMNQYGYCLNMLNKSDYTIEKGSKMPDMFFVSIDGKQLNTSQMNHNKVNYFFWATWCHGCKPELEALRKSDSKATWLVVSVDTDINRWKSHIMDDEFKRDTYYYTSAKADETLFRMGINYLPYIVEVEDGTIVRKGARIKDMLEREK